MPKLPTTFQSLDLTGFEDKNQRHNAITREMVDVACSVLQKNRIGIVVRSVQAALKHIYGLGGSAETVCQLLKEWRSENLAALKSGKGEKDLITAIVEASDDGLLDDSDIPEEYLQAQRQMAIAGYRLAYQKADTSVAGDRIQTLVNENDLLKTQLKDFPQLRMELEFYKAEAERQRIELREAYLNINKQQLADSETFRAQLEGLQNERNDLILKNNELGKQIAEMAEIQGKAVERDGEIAKLNGQLEAREREVMEMREQIQNLQTESGQKLVLESQLTTVQEQLKQANETITLLQVQLQEKSTSELQVDIDVDALVAERDSLELKVKELESQVGKRNKNKQPAGVNG
ncbi:hypothetical protein [Anabaena azotica]|uniref:Uncharacterized protein n=1 Tax=Anabaena azotica FACHB-119 TaxID=947527 RepID=A0ABR8CY37_9NOST|nr:hypothetical protein [Anabaena azotica]MBD2499840.1 hypothetical protein [Anabaena azotica FACHB-119]